jgi:hypothetical protein
MSGNLFRDNAMAQFIRWRCFWLALLAVLPAGCGRAEGEEEAEAPPPFVLSAGEIRLARDLAEERLDIHVAPLHPLERTCFIKVDLIPEPGQRQVMVHHYRYRDDATILTMVDLQRAAVLKVETLLHYPTALSAEEKAHAEGLAGKAPRIQALEAKIEVRPLHVGDVSDPRFGHRLALILLSNRDGLLVTPRVIVDLTTETVSIED